MRIIDVKIGKKDAQLKLFLHHDFTIKKYEDYDFEKKRRAILVIPGGGYNHVSEREGEPVALSYFAKGYEAAILNYSTNEDISESNPIDEAIEALEYLKGIESIDGNKISAIGFSAGGHLASSIPLFCNRALLSALILSYPVITMGEYTHLGTRDEITRNDISKRGLYSTELHITKDYPPTFIWSTRDDETVNVRNSLLMYEALLEKNIYSELHIYPSGKHGSSLATKESGVVNPYISSWFSESLKFLDSIYSKSI